LVVRLGRGGVAVGGLLDREGGGETLRPFMAVWVPATDSTRPSNSTNQQTNHQTRHSPTNQPLACKHPWRLFAATGACVLDPT
jgi:hypothetical protein